MKYKCSICGKVFESDEEIVKCPYCGAGGDNILKVEEGPLEDSMDDKSFVDKPGEKVSPVREESPLEEALTYEDKGPIPISDSNPGIVRIEERCIKCGRCRTICQEQVGVLYSFSKAKREVCLSCGQCILNCPVGALVPRFNYKKVFDYLYDTEKVVVAFTSPAVRVALGEEFQSLEDNVEGKMVTALKKLGFDYVFDTTFGADLTIMEEAAEFIERYKNGKNLPQFSSCCPGWVRYLEIYHPNLIKHLSTCKSPIGMQGTMIKNYFSEMMGIKKEDIIAVAVTPCTAKKREITLPDNRDTDYVITTTELAMMLREKEIDFNSLENSSFDKLMNRGSGGGVIFGSSGGVCEALVRTVYYFLTGKDAPAEFLEFIPVRGYNSCKEASVSIGEIKLNLLVIRGMLNIEDILKELDDGKKKYDFIEVMNCPLGCVGGGGQPLGIVSKQQEIVEKRSRGLYKEDSNLSIRASYQNPDIIDIYKSYLERPLSPKAEELLHTSYEDRSSILG